MNVRQRLILIGVAVVTVLMVLFPPYSLRYQGVWSAGYHFILMPPQFPPERHLPVNDALLLVQLLATWVVGAILWVIAGSR